MSSEKNIYVSYIHKSWIYEVKDMHRFDSYLAFSAVLTLLGIIVYWFVTLNGLLDHIQAQLILLTSFLVAGFLRIKVAKIIKKPQNKDIKILYSSKPLISTLIDTLVVSSLIAGGYSYYY